ncbi:MAG TPA: efflux RND transporter periplasmic adaptor subunit [Chthoniobacteraceae bacterium]|nr:efflux RND transporter periplasmic adaptor subunit [Chthoniobacteraceae bacterium]
MKSTIEPHSASSTPTPDLKTVLAGHSRRGKGWIWLLLLVVAAGGGAWWWSQRNGRETAAPPFVTEPLERGNISLTITATGNLEPTNQVTVGSELSGTVLEVFVDSNDQVKKEQPLARLDTSRLDRQIEGARAGLASAKARVAQVEATVREQEAALARQKELHRLSGGKVPSKAEMDAAIAAADRARADLGMAQASVGEAEAQIRMHESELAKAIIKSPIDGIVLTRSVEPGQTVAASFTAPELFVIAEKLEQMKLKVAIAEADIGRVEIGQRATFTVDAWPDRSYRASVTKVSFGSAVTDNVVTYETELEVSNDDLSLRPGMTATADVAVAERSNVFLVPAAALRFTPAPVAGEGQAAPEAQQRGSFVQSLVPMRRRGPRGSRGGGEQRRGGNRPSQVWTVKNGEAQPLKVRIGISDGRRTEIEGEGLSEGLPIILRQTPAPVAP